MARRGSAFLQSVLGANLDGLHPGLGFGPGLERAVVDNGRGGRGRLLVDNRALLGRGVPHDVKFGCLRERRSDGKGDDNGRKQKLLHVFLQWCLSFVKNKSSGRLVAGNSSRHLKRRQQERPKDKYWHVTSPRFAHDV